MMRKSSAFILSSFLHRHVLCLISLLHTRTHIHSLSHTHTHPLLSLILPAFLETPHPSWHTALLKHTATTLLPCPLSPSVRPSVQSSSLSGNIARPENHLAAPNKCVSGSMWKAAVGGLFFALENQPLQPCQRRGRSIEKVSFSFEHRRPFIHFIPKMFFFFPSCNRRALICVLLTRLITERLPASIPLTPPCPCFSSPPPRHPPFIVVQPDRPPVCTHAQRRFNKCMYTPAR